MLGQSSKDAMRDSTKHSWIWRMFLSSTVEASVFIWERITQTICIPVKDTEERSHLKTDVRHIWKVDRTIRWDFWSVSYQMGRFSMETIIFGQWWRSHQSLAYKGLCNFQILCYVLERRIRTQHQILFGKNSWVGSKIHQNTELWTQLTESRWNSSGIFPRIHHIAARRQSPRVHDQNGHSSAIPRTNYLHVDVQWHHMVIYRQWIGMCC